jgi:hypothetical protein
VSGRAEDRQAPTLADQLPVEVDQVMHAGAVHEPDLAQIDDRGPIVIVRQSVQRARQAHVRRDVDFPRSDNDIDVVVRHHVDAKAGG